MELAELIFRSDLVRALVVNASVCGWIWLALWQVEGGLQPQNRSGLAQWVRGRSGADSANAAAPAWSTLFIAVLNRVFTEKHFSWRCIWRTFAMLCLATIFFMVIVEIGKEDFIGRVTYAAQLRWAAILGNLTGAFIVLSVDVLVPTYLSILKTRWILNYLSQTRSSLATPLCLIADTLLTLVVFCAWNLLFEIFWDTPVGNLLTLDDRTLTKVWCLLSLGLGDCASTPYLPHAGAFLYPTFVVSLWMWFHLAAALVVRLALKVSFGRGLIERRLQLEDMPLTAMALTLLAVVTAIAWLGYAFHSLLA